MFFTASLYVALAIFGLGLIYKASTWFRYSIGIDAEKIAPSARIYAAVKGIFACLFSHRIVVLMKTLVVDVILQVKILRQDFLRWLMHMCLYGGFKQSWHWISRYKGF